MQRIWQRIDTWLAENAPHIANSFNSGASVDELNALEDDLNISLPNDVRESYLAHDGQRDDDAPALLDGMFTLMSLTEISAYWKTLQEAKDSGIFPNESEEDAIEVRSYWWHEKWIPLFSNGSGDLWCVDLDPTDYGKKGQIIEFWHDDVGRTLVAKSLRVLLKQFAQDLEVGNYHVEESGLYHVDLDDDDEY